MGWIGDLWAISALASEKLLIRCVMETCALYTIHPPLQIVDIGNGCEAYSTSLYIPARSELTATMQSLTRSQFFLDYNFNYTNVSNFVVWYKTNFVNLTKEEIESLKAKVLKLPTMSMDIFDKTLETIDEHYPFSLSPKLILALLVITGICFVVFGILFIWYKRKSTLTASAVGNLNKLIPSLTEKKPSLNSLLPILSELKFPKNNKNTNVGYHCCCFPEIHLLLMMNDHHLQWFLAVKQNQTNQKWLYPLPKHKLNLYLWNCSTMLLQIWTKRVKLSLNATKNICLIMNDGGRF